MGNEDSALEYYETGLRLGKEYLAKDSEIRARLKDIARKLRLRRDERGTQQDKNTCTDCPASGIGQ